MSPAELDLEAGRVTASRRELAALVAWDRGRRAADDPVIAGMSAAGLVDGGRVHPALRPMIGVLGHVRARAVVRSWRGGARPVVEVLAGPAGVVVLPGGHEPDTPQSLRWHPRPSALARVLAGVLDVTAEDGPPPFDAVPRAWRDYLSAACDAAAGISLVDLRWSARPGAPAASALVMAWCEPGGAGEIVPAPGDPALLACRPRHPIELWTALTRLTRGAGV
jgi:hypothetical protein